PQFVVGYMGMPRRYHTYPSEFQVVNVLSSAGATILATGLLLPMAYFAGSLKYCNIDGPNPYRATGLDGQTSSTPTTQNFEETPIVTRDEYDYENETEEVEVAG